MKDSKQVVVIGGGAAGMIAAIIASENGHQVSIIEKNDRLGKKLSATGNGRCNLTNTNMGEEYYFGSSPQNIFAIIDRFDVYQTLNFFARLGLICYAEEDGQVYPLSNQASSVVDCLRFKIAALDICVLTNQKVNSITKQNDHFLVSAIDKEIRADKVIVTTGGKAAPRLGGDESGYQLLAKLGHDATALTPALTQIKTDNTYPKAMQGIKINGTVSVFLDDWLSISDSGEILFTEYGVSGPPVLAVSRAIGQANLSKHRAYLSIDILPQYNKPELVELLRDKQTNCPYLGYDNFFFGILHNKIGRMLFKYCQLGAQNQPVTILAEKDLALLVDTIKEFKLAIKSTTGFANAQVTAGGISTDQVDLLTMQSKLCPGLYLAGEVLDVDGACGGYNLQWAWSSGYLAGHCYD